jgi:hypothetical protein
VTDPGDQKFWRLPFTVKDEDGVEWSVRLTAFDGEVAVEQYRHEPGRRVMRDIARMDPVQAALMAQGLLALSKQATVQVVEEVHDH